MRANGKIGAPNRCFQLNYQPGNKFPAPLTSRKIHKPADASVIKTIPMKTSTLLATTLLLAVTAFGTAGCCLFPKSSTPDATKPVGGKTLNLLQFRNDVQSTRTAVNRTHDALARLPDSPNAQDAYASFSTELAALSKLIDKTSVESAEVRNGGKALFAKWEDETQSIKNAEIRAAAELRRANLLATYENMITPLINARANFTPLLADFTDLQKVLAIDLTPAGIKTARPFIAKVGAEADATVKSLDALAAELEKIIVALPPTTVAPAN